jgi:hypothetical protein
MELSAVRARHFVFGGREDSRWEDTRSWGTAKRLLTEDLDGFVPPTEPNASRLRQALEDFGVGA